MRSQPRFVRMRLTSRSSSGPAKANRTRSNSGGDSCAGLAEHSMPLPENPSLPLVLAPPGSPFHEAATGALRAQGRKFEIVCTSSDFSVLAAAAAARVLALRRWSRGWRRMRLKPCLDKNLPLLPEVTLLLLARSRALALTSRRWVASVVETLQSV